MRERLLFFKVSTWWSMSGQKLDRVSPSGPNSAACRAIRRCRLHGKSDQGRSRSAALIASRECADEALCKIFSRGMSMRAVINDETDVVEAVLPIPGWLGASAGSGAELVLSSLSTSGNSRYGGLPRRPFVAIILYSPG